MSPYEMVREFHRAFGVAIDQPPTQELVDLRARLIYEETVEVVAALDKGHLPEIAQEFADLMYVVYGTAVSLGIRLDYTIHRVHRFLPVIFRMSSSHTIIALDEKNISHIDRRLHNLIYITYSTAAALSIDLNSAIAEVHRANMSKLGTDGKPIYRADGKILKGPHYQPPDMSKSVIS